MKKFGCTLELRDFKYIHDLFRHLGPDEDQDEYSAIDVEVDGDMDPPHPSVGAGAQVYLYSACTESGHDLLPFLTDKCIRKIESGYIDWISNQEVESPYDTTEERRGER